VTPAIIRVSRALPAVVTIHVFGFARIQLQDQELGLALQEAHRRCAEMGWDPQVENPEAICGGALHALMRESRREFRGWAIDVRPSAGGGRSGRCPACRVEIVEPEPSFVLRFH